MATLDLLRALSGAEARFLVVLTAVSGVRFEDAWPSRVHAAFGEAVQCNVID